MTLEPSRRRRPLIAARRLEQANRAITANAFHPSAIPGSGFTQVCRGQCRTLPIS